MMDLNPARRGRPTFQQSLDEANAIVLGDLDAKTAKKVTKEIEKAEKDLAKAQDELDKGKPDKAIDKYKKAWKHAQHATSMSISS